MRFFVANILLHISNIIIIQKYEIYQIYHQCLFDEKEFSTIKKKYLIFKVHIGIFQINIHTGENSHKKSRCVPSSVYRAAVYATTSVDLFFKRAVLEFSRKVCPENSGFESKIYETPGKWCSEAKARSCVIGGREGVLVVAL